MNNLQKSQGSQEVETWDKNVKIALTVLYDRLENPLSLDKLNKVSNDLKSEFLDLDCSLLITAMRNGAFAKYGRTFKLTVQEISFFIISYLKTDEARLLMNKNQKLKYPQIKDKQDRL